MEHAATPPAAITRAKIVAAARGWIGTPYQHQGSLRGVGCDCLGLVRGVWRELIGAEPEPPGAYSSDWAEASKREALAEAAFRHLVPVAVADFAAGEVHTGWIDEHPALAAEPEPDADTLRKLAAIAALSTRAVRDMADAVPALHAAIGAWRN